MSIYNIVEEPSFLKTRDTPLLKRSLKSEYLFFVDILEQLHCGMGNANSSVDLAGHYTPKNKAFKEKGYSKIQRKNNRS